MMIPESVVLFVVWFIGAVLYTYVVAQCEKHVAIDEGWLIMAPVWFVFVPMLLAMTAFVLVIFVCVAPFMWLAGKFTGTDYFKGVG